MKDLNTTSLNKISRDISGPPGRKSIRHLSAGALYLTGPIQDLLRSLDLLGPFTRALYKVSSQDHHVWHLYTRSPARSRPEIPTKDLYERSLLQELLTKSLRKTSIRQGPFEMFQLSTRSLPKTCRRDLFTRAVYKISSVSSQELSTRSLHKTSIRDLHTRALHKISSQDLYESLYKISSQDLYERYKISSQDPYERSLYKSSLQSVFTSPKGDVAMQDLLISLDHRGLFTAALCKISSQDLYMRDLYTRALYKIPSQDLYERSLYKSSLQDLFTRLLWEISLQELSTRSLHRTPIWDTSMQDRSLHSSSLQDLFTRPIWRGL